MLRSLWFSILFAVVALVAPVAARAAFDPLTAAPATSEIVIKLDTRKIMDSPLFAKIWAEVETPQTKAQLSLLQGVVGFNFLKDVDQIALFSRMNDDSSVGVLLEGRFDQAKLLTLVQANASYKSYEAQGRTVHEWFDGKENRKKYGSFLAPTVVAVWNSKDAMEASFEALADVKNSLAGSKEKGLVPAASDKLGGWMIAISAGENRPGAKLQIANLVAALELDPEALVLRATATAETKEAAAQMIEVMEGAKSFGLLQRENADLASLASLMTTGPGKAPNTAEMTMTLPAEKIIEGIHKDQAKKGLKGGAKKASKSKAGAEQE